MCQLRHDCYCKNNNFLTLKHDSTRPETFPKPSKTPKNLPYRRSRYCAGAKFSRDARIFKKCETNFSLKNKRFGLEISSKFAQIGTCVSSSAEKMFFLGVFQIVRIRHGKCVGALVYGSGKWGMDRNGCCVTNIDMCCNRAEFILKRWRLRMLF